MSSRVAPRRSRYVRSALLVTVLVTGAVWTAGANPLPEGAFMVHVQQPAATSCASWPATTCEEITQYTSASGLLEFDLYLYPLAYGELPVNTAVFECAWPPDWGFVDAELCGGALGSIDPGGATALISATWPDCPPVVDGLFLVGRVLLDVTNHGSFIAYCDTGSELVFGCPPEIATEWFLEGRAEAGVTCSYRFVDCLFQGVCQPEVEPQAVVLEAPAGGSAQAVVTAYIHGMHGLEPCHGLMFETTVPWLDYSTEWVAGDECAVTLTVDASALEPGDYSGWLRAINETVACTHISLEVLGAQGVPDPELPPTEDSREVSWGRVKTLYR